MGPSSSDWERLGHWRHCTNFLSSFSGAFMATLHVPLPNRVLRISLVFLFTKFLKTSAWHHTTMPLFIHFATKPTPARQLLPCAVLLHPHSRCHAPLIYSPPFHRATTSITAIHLPQCAFTQSPPVASQMQRVQSSEAEQI